MSVVVLDVARTWVHVAGVGRAMVEGLRGGGIAPSLRRLCLLLLTVAANVEVSTTTTTTTATTTTTNLHV